jgi:hypothetical protein
VKSKQVDNPNCPGAALRFQFHFYVLKDGVLEAGENKDVELSGIYFGLILIAYDTFTLIYFQSPIWLPISTTDTQQFQNTFLFPGTS